MSRANPRTTHLHAGIAAAVIRAKAEIHSWEDCDKFWRAGGSGQYGDERQLAIRSRNLRIRKVRPHFSGGGPHRYSQGGPCEYCGCSPSQDYPAYAIILYETPILIYHWDGFFEASNGGFNTPTTTSRLNQFGPPGWYFFHNKKKLWAWNGTNEFACELGILIYPKTGQVGR